MAAGPCFLVVVQHDGRIVSASKVNPHVRLRLGISARFMKNLHRGLVGMQDVVVVDTADVLTDFVTPLRGKVDELLADPAHLDGILADGAAKARAVASPTLRDVYDKVGFLAPSAS